MSVILGKKYNFKELKQSLLKLFNKQNYYYIMINENNTALLSSVVNYIQQPTKRARAKRKHLLNIIHYENKGSYVITQVVYRFSWQYLKRYDNINIFESEEYHWLINNYKLHNNIVKGVHVYYKEYEEKDKQTKRKDETLSISDEIFIDLPEVHYVDDSSDKEFFRMRSISYNYIGQVHWIQNQVRPALYINSIDTTHDSNGIRFDGNSIFMRININKAHANLANDIRIVNGAVYENKNQLIDRFVGHWFSYTMMLYYINVSHGWKFEDIDYDIIWNLGMYLLSFAKPFVEKDWIKGVKISHIRFLFERRLYNELSKGIKHYYLKLAKSKLIIKNTRYAFPSSMSKLNRKLFKARYIKPKTVNQEKISRRNKQIIELRQKGYSEYTIANVMDMKRSTVHKVLVLSSDGHS